MFVGHLAIGVALKALAPKTPTFALVMGVCVLDVLDGLFILIGLDRVRPDLDAGPYMVFDLVFIDWDHSLLAALVIAGLWAAVYRADRRTAALAAAAVLSHFVADWPVHNGDLALYPHATIHLGLGLWRTLGVWSWVLEGVFSALLLAWSACRLHRLGISLRWPIVLLAISYLGLSPWFSPLKLAAQAAPPWPHLLLGGLTLGSFLFLGIAVTRLIDHPPRLTAR